jgi:methionyl-tRNA formyltransferase
VLVIGTGLLRPPIIGVASRACLNLHGGQAEVYRGLDSHLWAIYHDDFSNLTTTLHHVDAELDTGDIVLQEALPLQPEVQLHQLRALNAQACARLSLLALTSLNEFDWLPSRRQIARGRYYSFMPTSLKDVCLRKFNRYVQTLPAQLSQAAAPASVR